MTISDADRRIKEETTAIYSCTLKDEDGNAISDVALTTLTLTLYDSVTGDIINDRDGQNVLNANNVTVASGVLTWTMQPEDTAIIHSSSLRDPEVHIALFEWTYDSGTKAGKHELKLEIVNLRKVE